ncbi:MAG: hypothetical protein ABSD58_13775 [Verrucomicrobiia bacterium]|jgi:hypothetical protein
MWRSTDLTSATAHDKYSGLQTFNFILRLLSVVIIALLIFVPLSGQDFFGGSGLGLPIWFFGLAVVIFIRLAAMIIMLGVDMARDLARIAEAGEALKQYAARANALSGEIALTTGRIAVASETTASYIERANTPAEVHIQTASEEPSNRI